MIELTEENLLAMCNMRETDMKLRDKWTELDGKFLVVIIPDTAEYLQEFIEDWLSVCPNGTAKRLKEFNKNIKKIARKKGVELNEFKRNLLMAREVARIKKQYATDHADLAKRGDESINVDAPGFTYLSEIVIVMNEFLNDSVEKFPKTISIFEEKQVRRTV